MFSVFRALLQRPEQSLSGCIPYPLCYPLTFMVGIWWQTTLTMNLEMTDRVPSTRPLQMITCLGNSPTTQTDTVMLKTATPIFNETLYVEGFLHHVIFPANSTRKCVLNIHVLKIFFTNYKL